MEELIAYSQALEAQIAAMRVMLGILLAHSPGALEIAHIAKKQLPGLLLAHPMTDAQLAVTQATFEQALEQAQSFVDRVRDLKS